MNNLIHIPCGSDDVSYCQQAELYRCDFCEEEIIYVDELINKRVILVKDERIVETCKEAA